MDDHDAEERWRSALMGIPPTYAFMRRLFSHMPSSPRCKNCTAPFAGPGARVARTLGFRRWERNPTFCGRCLPKIEARGLGGAEVELSMLFADIRGSTALGETMSASDFNGLLSRFYSAATDALVRHGGMVDKFVGDEVVALFLPAFAGADHAAHALDAARDVLAATGHRDASGPWIPVGVGVHSGVAFVGAIGAVGSMVDITAVGDAVNTAARLASAAAAGEIIMSTDAAVAAGLDPSGLDRRQLDLKGKAGPVDVVALTIDVR